MKYTLAVLAVIIILASCVTVPLPSGRETEQYLKENAVELPIGEKSLFDGAEETDREALYTALDTVYLPYRNTARVVFLGERHACAGNFVILDRLLPYFIERFGVTCYLSEKGVAEGFLTDRYLRTGDERIIRSLIEMVRYSAAYTADQFESFRRMRELWLSLPEEKRFRYIGIDVGHGLSAPVLALYHIIEDLGAEAPAPLDRAVSMYRDYVENGYPLWGDPREDEIRSLILDLRSALNTEQRLRDYLGEYADITALICDSAEAAYRFYDKEAADGYDAAGPLREAAIMDHFVRHNELSASPSDEVYFGQWGGFHINRRPLGGDTPVAALIDGEDGPFPGQVLSTTIFYNDCEYRDRRSESPKPAYDPAGDYLGRFFSAPYVLIPLQAAGSPFLRDVYLISGGAAYPGATTDYFQAALLLQNAPAARAYGD